MNLSASAVMASHLSKTQVNNYLNHSPTRSQYSGSGEIARDISTKASPQYTSSSQRYSPEVEGLRREINDQMRNYFYSLSSDINVLKKDNSENKGHMEELRRELDSMNSKVAQLRVNSDNSELQLRESYSSKENKSAKIDNWMRNDNNLGDINERIYQISRQIHTLNSEMETLKKPNYVSKEQFSRTMGDIIDELERKLQIINERVRERIEEMDISLVRSQNEKEKDFNRLYFDMKNMQSSLIKTNDQVSTFAQNNEANVEEHVKKMMNSFSNDFKNLSTTPSSAEHKYKSSKKDEHHSILGSSTYHNKEVEVKLRELDSISQTIGLLEKEMRAKTDMIDLNINSIKRNLELELSIQLKHMVLPIQKNLEQYLQSTESRFSALEDAVLNHMKRDSYIMTAERASRLRGSGSLDLRGSNFDENIQFAPKPGFNNISVIDSHVENRQDKRTSQPESRGGSGMKDRGRERDRHATDAFRIDEVDSVLSMNETLQSTTKNEGRYDMKHDQRFTPPPYQDTLEAEEESEEEEAPATNTAKEILSDKDRNKKQKKAADFFKDLETKPLPETMFRDFPSTSAMKSALEMEHPDNKVQDRANSAKKKKPEIDVTETHKNSLRDAPKKPGNSPFNKLSLATNAYMDDEEEEEQAPPLRKNEVAAKGREAPDHFNDDADEFQGNIKGLLRKSRNKKENNFQEEEERPASKQKGAAQKAPQYEPEVPKYGKEPVADAFKKNPLPKKDFEKKNALEKQAQKELPPVDTKAMKNFNKGGNLAPPKGPQGKGLNQPGTMPQNMGYQRGYDGGNQWQGEEDDGESVEEIVYNVDEEGFLVDEQGNYLVDEQGNFLQLSPEQMREIEERDLVYEKEF